LTHDFGLRPTIHLAIVHLDTWPGAPELREGNAVKLPCLIDGCQRLIS
jgi:hypothetical protein